MGYFKIIIATGFAGVVTAIACVVLAASKQLGWGKVGYYLLAFLGVYAACGCVGAIVNECVAAKQPGAPVTMRE